MNNSTALTQARNNPASFIQNLEATTTCCGSRRFVSADKVVNLSFNEIVKWTNTLDLKDDDIRWATIKSKLEEKNKEGYDSLNNANWFARTIGRLFVKIFSTFCCKNYSVNAEWETITKNAEKAQKAFEDQRGATNNNPTNGSTPPNSNPPDIAPFQPTQSTRKPQSSGPETETGGAQPNGTSAPVNKPPGLTSTSQRTQSGEQETGTKLPTPTDPHAGKAVVKEAGDLLNTIRSGPGAKPLFVKGTNKQVRGRENLSSRPTMSAIRGKNGTLRKLVTNKAEREQIIATEIKGKEVSEFDNSQMPIGLRFNNLLSFLDLGPDAYVEGLEILLADKEWSGPLQAELASRLVVINEGGTNDPKIRELSSLVENYKAESEKADGRKPLDIIKGLLETPEDEATKAAKEKEAKQKAEHDAYAKSIKDKDAAATNLIKRDKNGDIIVVGGTSVTAVLSRTKTMDLEDCSVAVTYIRDDSVDEKGQHIFPIEARLIALLDLFKRTNGKQLAKGLLLGQDDLGASLRAKLIEWKAAGETHESVEPMFNLLPKKPLQTIAENAAAVPSAAAHNTPNPDGTTAASATK